MKTIVNDISKQLVLFQEEVGISWAEFLCLYGAGQGRMACEVG